MGLLLFFLMVYMHIFDDYCLQGILSSMKQKKWWEDNAPDELYKYDYIMALVEHAFSWSISISLPLMGYAFLNHIKFTDAALFITLSIFINTAIHAYIDNLKANKHIINLIQDQAVHFIQIIFTCLIFTILFI